MAFNGPPRKNNLDAAILRIPSIETRNKVTALVRRAQAGALIFVSAKSVFGLAIIIAALLARRFNINRRKYVEPVTEMI